MGDVFHTNIMEQLYSVVGLFEFEMLFKFDFNFVTAWQFIFPINVIFHCF